MKLEVKYVGEVQKLQVAPDDVLVVRIKPGWRSQKEVEVVEKTMRELFGKGQRIVLVAGDIEFSVLAATQLSAGATLTQQTKSE